MAKTVDLEARLDELFAAAPGDFVATRDDLVKELKAEGRPDDAAAVKALRRPTVAVAAINRAARQQSHRFVELVELGDQLAALQAHPPTDRETLRDLTRERRTLLTALTDLAARSTERPEGTRATIASTLDAASLDHDLREQLVRGRLTHELTPTARFVTREDAPRSRDTSRRKARAATPPRDELAARRARAELDAARARADTADETLRQQVEAATDATEMLTAAQRRVADLEAALADARAELAEAKRNERQARRAERRARTEQERVASALHAAERGVER